MAGAPAEETQPRPGEGGLSHVRVWISLWGWPCFRAALEICHLKALARAYFLPELPQRGDTG